jgi:hypothetical protein
MQMLGSTLLCAALVLIGASAAAESHLGLRAETPTSERRAPKLDPDPDAHRDAHPDVQRATLLTTRMAIRSDRAQTWLAQARGKGKRARAACLDDKLSQLHALERLASEDARAIRVAAARGVTAAHRLIRLETLHGTSKKLYARAARCGKPVSRRVRMRTTCHVKVHRPALPGEPAYPQRTQSQRPRRTRRT